MIATLATLLTTRPEITAWVVGYNPASVEAFAKNADRFDTVFMEAYGVTTDGTAYRRKASIPAFKQARKIAKDHHVQFLAMVSNYEEGAGTDGFDPKRMANALATTESRKKFASSLVATAREDLTQGLDLDIESMRAEDRDRYSAFVAELAKQLHTHGMKLSVTVHPKDSDPGNWEGPKAHDYKALGKSADRLNVMTYDYSWTDGPEGPVAPDAWVERVINFAKSQAEAKKIGLGIPCYGYDWSKKPAGEIAIGDPRLKDATVDPASGELIVGKAHFGGAESFRHKYELAKRLGVGSVAFWYCGTEDPKIWDFLPRR